MKKLQIKTFGTSLLLWSVLAMPVLADTMIENPLPSSDPNEIIANIVSVILGVVGAIALMFFVWGGVLMLISGGSPEKTKKGRDTLMWATLGLIIIFGSFGIVRAIFQAMGGESIV